MRSAAIRVSYRAIVACPTIFPAASSSAASVCIATSAGYTGQFNHSYAFYGIATDGAGNIQASKSSADTTINVPVSQVGACDVGSYGTRRRTFQQLINEALGSRQGTDDLNHDGSVNVVDLQFGGQRSPETRLLGTTEHREFPSLGLRKSRVPSAKLFHCDSR